MAKDLHIIIIAVAGNAVIGGWGIFVNQMNHRVGLRCLTTQSKNVMETATVGLDAVQVAALAKLYILSRLWFGEDVYVCGGSDK